MIADVVSASLVFFFFNDTATTEIYTRPYTLSLHDALPISSWRWCGPVPRSWVPSRSSEEHTSELQSHGLISYAVFCLKKKKKTKTNNIILLINKKKKKQKKNIKN